MKNISIFFFLICLFYFSNCANLKSKQMFCTVPLTNCNDPLGYAYSNGNPYATNCCRTTPGTSVCVLCCNGFGLIQNPTDYRKCI